MYKEYIDKAIKRLFYNVEKHGFWDDKNNKIIERLECDKNFNWYYDSNYNSLRYASFCIFMLLLSKKHFGLDTNQNNDKIIRFLENIKKNIKYLTLENYSYGAIQSLIISDELYNTSFYNDEEHERYKKYIKNLIKNKDNQKYLGLIGIKYLKKKYLNDIDLSEVKNIINRLILSIDNKYNFQTGDIRATYHQRNMYVCWVIILLNELNKTNKSNIILKKLIQYYYENKMDYDYGLIWHPSYYKIKLKNMSLPIYNPKTSKYYYECHQCFYVNTISFYQIIFKEIRLFDSYKKKSIEWIFGMNRIKKNLVEISKIDIPIRIIDNNGNLYVKNEMFKGSYEIGSYILALSSIQYLSNK
jgi:hypothetical protein